MRHSIVSTHRSWPVFLALAAVSLAALACGFEGGAFGATPTSPGAASQQAAGSEPPLVGVTSDLTNAPAEGILITAPQPGQGARGTLKIEGLVGAPLASQLNAVVRDAKGTVLATTRPALQPQVDQRSQFSADVAVPPDLPAQTGRVQVYAISPQNNGVTHLSSVEVQLNGEAKPAVPIDPQTPEGILITFPSPNAEVKGVVKVAAATMLGNKIVIEVHDANDKTIGRLEQAIEQSPGVPAQVLAEVPIQVTAAGPGRVVVYAVNARDGLTEHLNSVEVNLMP
jgi:hypothetical protein